MIDKKLKGSEISFGKANKSDSLRISILLKTVNIEAYAWNGISSEIANYTTKRFSPENIEKIINQNPEQLIIAYKNGNPIGVAEVLYKSKCPVKKTDVPELSKLYVLARFYGQGIGLILLQEAEKEIWKKGFKEVNLEVWTNNDRAIGFYKKHGYQSIGTVDFPMDENTYENLVMNKILNKENE